MANTFALQILTPERLFLSEDAEMLSVVAEDGEIGIQAKHAPAVISTVAGELRILADGQWRTAAASEGFVTVTPDQVVMMLQTCEWPEELDENRARRDLERAREILRQKGSIQEHIMAKSMLSRAMVRLRVVRNGSMNN